MVEDASSVRPAGPEFTSTQRAADYFAAYDAVLARWPVPVEARDVPSVYGTTRVNVCGTTGGTPLVLLHGGGATSTVWFANVEDLASRHRVYAVDVIGQPGHSVHNGQKIGSAEDLMAWLDAVLDHLGLDSACLGGHSYGAWIAMSYALRSPQRVRKLALLDPTKCFAGMKLTYLLHALPLLRPTPQRLRAFITWEAGGIPLDPAWLELMALGATFPQSKIVMPRRPRAERLRASSVPTLVLLAEQSRSHDIRRVAANAARLMPKAATAVLPGASHHSVPTENPETLNRRLLEFLA